MDLQTFMAVFAGVFTAELGDKTQLATLCFTADGALSRLEVFLAAGFALILSAVLGAFCGALIGRIIPPEALKAAAGIFFVVMGLKFLREGAPLRLKRGGNKGGPPCA